MNNLNLCKDHKQEWKQSEYDKENCDYCKLQQRNLKLIKVENALREIASSGLILEGVGCKMLAIKTLTELN